MSLSTPFSDCSKPHRRSLCLPASLFKMISQKTISQTKQVPSLDRFILCLLHQQPSCTHITLAFSFQYPKGDIPLPAPDTHPSLLLSYPFPSMVLQLLMVQTLALCWILSPGLRNMNKCFLMIRLSPIPTFLSGSYCPLPPSFSKPSI